MIQRFELNPEQIKVRNILTNKNFLEVEIYAISNAEPNRNGSCFTIDSMRKGLGTFIDKPIVGFFNKSGDFEQHNAIVNYDPELETEYWDNTNGEQILGFIRQSDHREIVDKDGLTWICCTAMIYTQYNYKQVKRLLKDKRKKVSVEVVIVDSEVKNGIEYIHEFELTGITILGSKNGVPIQEGIQGAHLSILDKMDNLVYSNQKQALTFAYEKLENKNKEGNGLAKDDIGTKGALKLDKSKEAMSDTDWGSVDKTALRNRVVAASNFKTIAKDVFLDLREGWEDGETSKLKYPVMQLKDEDELVYNRGGLASAKGYAEKNGDTEVLEKLKAIYDKLDLVFEEEEKYDCSKFCDFYDDDDTDADNDHGKDDDKGHDDDVDDDDDGDSDDESKSEEGSATAGAQEVSSVLQEQCDDLRMKCEEYETKCGDYEAKCTEYENRCVEYENTIAKLKEEMAKFGDYEDVVKALEAANAELTSIRQKEQEDFICGLMKKMNLSQEDVKQVWEKCANHEFANVEQIEKEMAYIVFQRECKKAEAVEQQASRFAVNLDPVPTFTKNRSSKTVQERLKENIKK